MDHFISPIFGMNHFPKNMDETHHLEASYVKSLCIIQNQLFQIFVC